MRRMTAGLKPTRGWVEMTDNPVSQARITLATDQYLYTSHAHLELVVLAYMTGRNLDTSLAAAKAHLDHYKDRP